MRVIPRVRNIKSHYHLVCIESRYNNVHVDTDVDTEVDNAHLSSRMFVSRCRHLDVDRDV